MLFAGPVRHMDGADYRKPRNKRSFLHLLVTSR